MIFLVVLVLFVSLLKSRLQFDLPHLHLRSQIRNLVPDILELFFALVFLGAFFNVEFQVADVDP